MGAVVAVAVAVGAVVAVAVGAVVAVAVGVVDLAGLSVGAVVWATAIEGGAVVGATVGAVVRAGRDTITSSGSGVGVAVSATSIAGSSTGAVESAPCAALHTPSTRANPDTARRLPSAPESFRDGVSDICERESYRRGRAANVLTITRGARSRARARRVAGFI